MHVYRTEPTRLAVALLVLLMDCAVLSSVAYAQPRKEPLRGFAQVFSANSYYYEQDGVLCFPPYGNSVGSYAKKDLDAMHPILRPILHSINDIRPIFQIAQRFINQDVDAVSKESMAIVSAYFGRARQEVESTWFQTQDYTLTTHTLDWNGKWHESQSTDFIGLGVDLGLNLFLSAVKAKGARIQKLEELCHASRYVFARRNQIWITLRDLYLGCADVAPNLSPTDFEILCGAPTTRVDEIFTLNPLLPPDYTKSLRPGWVVITNKSKRLLTDVYVIIDGVWNTGRNHIVEGVYISQMKPGGHIRIPNVSPAPPGLRNGEFLLMIGTSEGLVYSGKLELLKAIRPLPISTDLTYVAAEAIPAISEFGIEPQVKNINKLLHEIAGLQKVVPQQVEKLIAQMHTWGTKKHGGAWTKAEEEARGCLKRGELPAMFIGTQAMRLLLLRSVAAKQLAALERTAKEHRIDKLLASIDALSLQLAGKPLDTISTKLPTSTSNELDSAIRSATSDALRTIDRLEAIIADLERDELKSRIKSSTPYTLGEVRMQAKCPDAKRARQIKEAIERLSSTSPESRFDNYSCQQVFGYVLRRYAQWNQ